MIGRRHFDTSGAVAVEFALVIPIFIMTALMLIQGAIAFQRWNAMQTVTGIVARCVAIHSPLCTAQSRSSGVRPEVAYAISVASANSAGPVAADQVVIDTVAPTGGLTYSRVSITFLVTLPGTTITLRSSNRFPQL